jgi:hypothetical protein
LATPVATPPAGAPLTNVNRSILLVALALGALLFFAPKGVPTENEHDGRTAVLAGGVGDTCACAEAQRRCKCGGGVAGVVGDGEAGMGRLPHGLAAQVGQVDWGVGSEGVSRGRDGGGDGALRQC